MLYKLQQWLDGVNLAMVCDLDEKNLKFCKDKYGIPHVTTDYKEVLESPDIDAVSICTSNETHYQICKDAFEAGKHALVEKPVTLNSKKAMELVELAKKKKLVFAVGHIFRFNNALAKIKELGMKPAVSLNPHTDVGVLENVLSDLNMVLVMTVNPGFGGQKFIEQSYEKIRKLKKMISDARAETLIQVDGGVTEKNIVPLIEAGVDVFVVGNTIFSASEPQEIITHLKNPL